MKRLVVLFFVFALALFGQDLKSGFVTTSDGVRLHYLEAGRGPAIVFQPGWTMPASIWEPQIRHLSQRYRVVAIDPRSQGDSSKPSEGHYPERRARDIYEVVQALKLAPAVLVGWSMGVPELLTYVDRFGSSTVRALVLVDGAIGRDPDPKQLPALAAWLKSFQSDRKRATANFVRSMFHKRQPEEYYARLTEAALRTPTNTAMTLMLNMVVGSDRRAVLPRIDRPVLFVGAVPMKDQAALVTNRIPSAWAEIFENAGHAVFIDDAQRFNSLLDAFLARLP